MRRLLTRRSARQAEGAYVVEGTKLVEEALQRGADVEGVYWAPGAPPALLARAHDHGIRVFELAAGVMERVADAVTPQPVLAVVATARSSLEDLRDATMVLVGAEVRDPGNAGTLLRTARAAGADGVVWSPGSVDLRNPKTVRASAGALFGSVVVEGVGVDQALAKLGGWGLERLAAVPAGGCDHAGMDLTRPFALVVGNEAHGLAPGRTSEVDRLVTIPMAADTESLYVATATGVILFEAARQRRPGGAVQ